MNVINICEWCHTCHLPKGSKRNSWLFQLVPLYHVPGEDSMDFVLGLAKTSRTVEWIFLVIDCFSKMAHFILCSTTADAFWATKLFFKEVLHPHGLLMTIVSNRDTKSHDDPIDDVKDKATILHCVLPKTDGQMKLVNWSLGQLLRCLIRDHITIWDFVLPIAWFALNN